MFSPFKKKAKPRAPQVVAASSEESHELRSLGGSRFVVNFDPLDGSSNVDANIPTGTIFGIYEEPEGCVIDAVEAQQAALRAEVRRAAPKTRRTR